MKASPPFLASLLGAGLILAAAAPPAAAADRARPEAGPVVPFIPPTAVRFSIAGLPVHVVERHSLPVVTLLLLVRAGASQDPRGREGVAAATARMVAEGAAGRNALEFDDALTFLGARLDTSSSWDGSWASLFVPSARIEPALALLADVAFRPDFAEAEWKRVQAETLASLLQARTSPGAVAAAGLLKAVFGDTRYGTPAGGTAVSVGTITREDLVSFHRQYWCRGNAALVVVGDVTLAALKPILEKALRDRVPEVGLPAMPPAPRPLERQVLWLVDRPDAAQSAIRVGGVAGDRLAPDRVEIAVTNTLLGGSFTSRLNDNLREKKGYTYGAGSRFDARRSGGLFVAASDVQTDVTAAAVTEFLKELVRIRTKPTEEEAARARSYLALGFAADWETTAQIASRIGETVLYGLPDDEWRTWVSKVLAVGPQEIESAARRRIDPATSAIVVVGDRRKIEVPLGRLGIGEWKILSVEDVMGPAPRR